MKRRTSAVDQVAGFVPLAWLAVLFLVPLGFAVVFSLAKPGFGGRVTLAWNWANYANAFAPIYRDAFLHTVVFALGCSALCLVLGYPIAYVIARHAGRFRLGALALVAVPYLTSLLVRVMSWQMLLAQGGVIDSALQALGVPWRFDLSDSVTAVVIGTIAVYLPITVLTLAVVIERIPGSALEAGADLGGGPWGAFLHITLPLSRPGLATAALLTAVPMLGELVVPQLLGGGKGLFISQAISDQYTRSQNYAVGSAMVVVLLAVVGIVVAVLVRLSRGFEAVAR